MLANALIRYGWNLSVAESFIPFLTDPACTPGRVLRVDRGECDIATTESVIRTRTLGIPVCTGDWVAVHDYGTDPAVRELIPRRTAILRSSASARSESQVLAANVDTVLVTTALDGDVDLGRIERLLALAWESGAQPIVVLTKADAAEDITSSVADVTAVSPGASVVPVSSTTGEGIDILTAMLDGTTVLLGPSGAGKSTLANTLLGEELLATNDVRSVDGKGRHTTVRRELLPLPSGGVLIDTPGLRGVGLWDAADGISTVFSDIEELAERCRFDDCGHNVEPGCAVLEAVEAGTLPERRLTSYRKLQRENNWVASRSDARLRADRDRELKVITRDLRRRYSERGHR